MQFDSIVFDLDGTLWDTTPVCAQAWNSILAREKIRYREITTADVRAVTGRPHDDCIRHTFADLEPLQVQALIEGTATEDNRLIAEQGGILYPEVETGLSALSESYRLFVVSNCQKGYIETFFEHSGLGGLFEDYECFGNTGQPKSHNLLTVIQRNSVRAPLMVGDAEGDEVAARDCAIPFAFVSYGFGSVTQSDFRFGSFSELTRFLLSFAY